MGDRLLCQKQEEVIHYGSKEDCSHVRRKAGLLASVWDKADGYYRSGRIIQNKGNANEAVKDCPGVEKESSGGSFPLI